MFLLFESTSIHPHPPSHSRHLGASFRIRIHVLSMQFQNEKFSIADKANKNERRIPASTNFHYSHVPCVSCSFKIIPRYSNWTLYFFFSQCIFGLRPTNASEPTITLSIDSFHFNLFRSSLAFLISNFISFPIWFYSPWTAFYFHDTLTLYSWALKVQLE